MIISLGVPKWWYSNVFILWHVLAMILTRRRICPHIWEGRINAGFLSFTRLMNWFPKPPHNVSVKKMFSVSVWTQGLSYVWCVWMHCNPSFFDAKNYPKFSQRCFFRLDLYHFDLSLLVFEIFCPVPGITVFQGALVPFSRTRHTLLIDYHCFEANTSRFCLGFFFFF